MTVAEPDGASGDVMAYLQTRGEADRALRAKTDEAGALLAQEQAGRRSLEAEVASLQVAAEPVLLGSAGSPADRSGRLQVPGAKRSSSALQAEHTRQQELRETLQSQQLALRAEHDAALTREVSRTSSAYGLLRKAEKDLVRLAPADWQ